jgi:hypothetical protein
MKRPPSIMDHIQEQLDPVHTAKLKALDLFLEIRESIGDAKARWVFAKWGTPPSRRRRQEINNDGLLSRLDLMSVRDRKTGELRPCPNVLKLAKQLAKENESLPREQQRGAGSTDVHALEKHIRDLVKKRETGLANRTWHGVITHEQAIRHFGAKKVETFSPKK